MGKGPIKDFQLPTADLSDASVTPGKLRELIQHGTAVAITQTARYVTFPVAYGGTPEITLGMLGSPEGRIVRIRRGSFTVNRAAAGTSRAMWLAIGPRA